MKIERIKRSFNFHGVYHGQLPNGAVVCRWTQDGKNCMYFATSYSEAYSHLKDIGILSSQRYYFSRSSR